MNNKFFSILIAMAMVVVGLTLASCGDDEDETVKPNDKATEAYLTPTFYVSEAMMDYFDATCTIDGKTVTLTKDNTVADKITVEGITFNLRKYTWDAKTFKTFPSSFTIVQNVKAKSGVNLKNISRLDQFVIYTHVGFANNNTSNYADGEWKTITGKFGSVFQEGVHFDMLTDEDLKDYQNSVLTTTVNMTTADEATVSAAFTRGE